jgi:hypothetical protein
MNIVLTVGKGVNRGSEAEAQGTRGSFAIIFMISKLLLYNHAHCICCNKHPL